MGGGIRRGEAVNGGVVLGRQLYFGSLGWSAIGLESLDHVLTVPLV